MYELIFLYIHIYTYMLLCTRDETCTQSRHQSEQQTHHRNDYNKNMMITLIITIHYIQPIFFARAMIPANVEDDNEYMTLITKITVHHMQPITWNA